MGPGKLQDQFHNSLPRMCSSTLLSLTPLPLLVIFMIWRVLCWAYEGNQHNVQLDSNFQIKSSGFHNGGASVLGIMEI